MIIPEQVVGVGFGLPPVARVHLGRQRQRVPVAGRDPRRGNSAISIASRSRGPASPCTGVIACSGIPASSRRSAGSTPMPCTASELAAGIVTCGLAG
jgi:hypothetical protein